MPTDLSPTARALRTVEILRNRPGVTADELAAGLGVTERAARRYVGILREAGIPVESTRGPYGGYRLGRGTRLPPVVFTEPEALGLVMAVLDGQPAATDADDIVGLALSKVIRALPDSVGRQAATLRAHASATPDRYSTRPDPATAGALVAAIAARRGVTLTYRSRSSSRSGSRSGSASGGAAAAASTGRPGGEWEAEVDPWAIVVRHGRWYLLCHSHRADAIRTYRIDRIRLVRQTGRAFTPPDDLDPVTVVAENLATGWDFPTRVVFEAPPAEVAPWIHAAMGRLEACGDGCVLVGSTNNPSMYAQEWLARLPFAFRVDGGPQLRAAVAMLAARLTSAVTARPGTAGPGTGTAGAGADPAGGV